MGYSIASQEGQKRFGKKWRKTIKGIPDVLDEISKAVDAEDAKAIVNGMRSIFSTLSKHMTQENATCGEWEALEWFQEEDPTYEIEEGTLQDWVQEFDFRLSEIYDWADYNRVWIAPDKSPRE